MTTSSPCFPSSACRISRESHDAPGRAQEPNGSWRGRSHHARLGGRDALTPTPSRWPCRQSGVTQARASQPFNGPAPGEGAEETAPGVRCAGPRGQADPSVLGVPRCQRWDEFHSSEYGALTLSQTTSPVRTAKGTADSPPQARRHPSADQAPPNLPGGTPRGVPLGPGSRRPRRPPSVLAEASGSSCTRWASTSGPTMKRAFSARCTAWAEVGASQAGRDVAALFRG
jgi:hypothetical protein